VRFVLKPLPAHWSYLLSKKAAGHLMDDLSADCRLIEYMGTRRKPTKLTPGLYGAGSIQARAVAAGWCYRLRLWGLPDPVLGEQRHELGALVREDIATFVGNREADPQDPTATPLERRFFFQEGDGVLQPGFSTHKIEGVYETWAQRTPWWTTHETI
jgi:hypothetical protein